MLVNSIVSIDFSYSVVGILTIDIILNIRKHSN